MSKVLPEFHEIIGNDEVKNYLSSMVKRELVGNSYLFFGDEGIGKKRFALSFAEALLCTGNDNPDTRERIRKGNHPDVRVYRPEGKIAMHSIEALRRLGEEVHLSPFEAKWKVFIIDAADRMLPTSANALLKTFEEPPENTVILLISTHPGKLLPTVLSRCRKVAFASISDQDMESWFKQRGVSEEKAKKFSRLASGSFSRGIKLLQNSHDPMRETLYQTFAKSDLKSYSEIKKLSDHLASFIQENKEKIQLEAKESFFSSPAEDLSAKNRDAIQKEIDGFVTCETFALVDQLLQAVISWFRDSELLLLSGKEDLLQNLDYKDAISKWSKNSGRPSLEDITEWCAFTKKTIERSSPMAPAFEALFLRFFCSNNSSNST